MSSGCCVPSNCSRQRYFGKGVKMARADAKKEAQILQKKLGAKGVIVLVRDQYGWIGGSYGATRRNCKQFGFVMDCIFEEILDNFHHESQF